MRTLLLGFALLVVTVGCVAPPPRHWRDGPSLTVRSVHHGVGDYRWKYDLSLVNDGPDDVWYLEFSLYLRGEPDEQLPTQLALESPRHGGFFRSEALHEESRGAGQPPRIVLAVSLPAEDYSVRAYRVPAHGRIVLPNRGMHGPYEGTKLVVWKVRSIVLPDGHELADALLDITARAGNEGASTAAPASVELDPLQRWSFDMRPPAE